MTNDHLGGHLNKTHVDEGSLLYLIEKFDIKSMVDIGCGPGGQVALAKEKGLTALGIDGDETLEKYNEIYAEKNFYRSPYIHFHDFTKGPMTFPFTTKWEQGAVGTYNTYNNFDLAWSVEFLEHVEAKYQKNYMGVFEKARFALVTHALPGQPGHHHVNCQFASYWINVFNNYGFDFDEENTIMIRSKSTMKKPFMQKSGLFFQKKR